jgi:hypothetical protein
MSDKKKIISYSPIINNNPLLEDMTTRIINTAELEPAAYHSDTLAPEEKYGVETLRELIVMVVAIIGIVLRNSNIKNIWQLLLKPLEVLKSLKALYDAGVFIAKKYKSCYNEISDLSRSEAWLLMNILIEELRSVLGKPSQPDFVERYAVEK